MKTLISVYSEEVQKKVFEEYGVKVPMDMVYCTKDNIINSHLYFEMWEPSKDYINK